jgi:preprotein translocase subunit YajC
MSFLRFFGITSTLTFASITSALADTPITNTHAASHSSSGGLMSMLPMLVIFVVVFYFLLVRPQTKRAKEQKKMMSDIKVGDEVATTGGIVGQLKMVKEDFVTITTNCDTELTMQKAAIASILPKGTMESMK